MNLNTLLMLHIPWIHVVEIVGGMLRVTLREFVSSLAQKPRWLKNRALMSTSLTTHDRPPKEAFLGSLQPLQVYNYGIDYLVL